jgi:alkaline phosphatase D
MHGFDPGRVPEMKAIFFAAGPQIRPGTTVAPFDNVHLYAFLAHILGLKPAANDGSLNVLSGILRDNGNDTADQEKQRRE